MNNRLTNVLVNDRLKDVKTQDVKEIYNHVFYTDRDDTETPDYIYRIAKAFGLECEKPLCIDPMSNRKEFVGFAKQYAMLLYGEEKILGRFVVEASRLMNDNR